MISSENVRSELPTLEVFVQQPDRTLLAASQTLMDDVAEDLSKTRETITEMFGEHNLPPIDEELEQTIQGYFSDRHWALPKSVVINPATDAIPLRSVLQSAKFRSVSDEEFFTGAHNQAISPGGSPQHDLVIFHDWRTKYQQEIHQLVTEWGYAISDEELRGAVELKTADFIVHEFAHLAGGLAVTAVVLEQVDGEYRLADRTMSGFIDIRDDIPTPEFHDESNYYTGPALDESWAALNSSNFILSYQGFTQRNELPISERYGVVATITSDEGQEFDSSVSGLHSEDAGYVIEKLDDMYPGIINIMNEVANSKTTLPVAMDMLKNILPANVLTLLNEPQYKAWQELRAHLEV